MHPFRLALRALGTTPIASLVIVLTLALGIGANTAIFSVVNSLLLRTLPVPEPGRLVTVSSDFALAHGFKSGVGWNYQMWRRMQEAPPLFDGMLLWSQPTFNLAQGGERDPARALLVSGTFFDTLRLRPRLGRLLRPDDDKRGGGKDGPVAVISYRFWQQRFSGTADAIGKTLTLEGAPFTIVGVTPADFLGIEVGQAFDVAVPLETEPLILGQRSAIDEPRAFTFCVLVRLKPEQSLEAATALLRSVQPLVLGVTPDRVAEVRPPFLREPFVAVPAPTGTSDFSRLRTQYQRPIVTLMVLVGVVLVIACVNVASVFLARAVARRQEIAVRIALGATRRHLLPQLLLESVVLATTGAALGLLLSLWGSRTLVAQLSTADAALLFNLTPDWRVLGFTAIAALGTALLFGAAPALRATNVQPVSALRAPSGSQTTPEGAGRLMAGLLVLQIALSMMLTVAATLLLTTFSRLLHLPLGFDSDRVLIATIDTTRIPTDATARLGLYQQLADALHRVPAVVHVAASSDTPLSKRSQAPIMVKAERVQNTVTPEFFATYGIRLAAGRDFTAHDAAGAPQVAIVNEAYVRKFLPDKPALGELVDGRTVVGVVGDTVFATVRGGVRPTVFTPLTQAGGPEPPRGPELTISIRVNNGPPARLAHEVGAAFTAIDPGLVFSFTPMQALVDASVSQERLLAGIASLFGALALLLAGLGLYGITSYAISRRQLEIGIRMALGAERTHVLRLVLVRCLAVTVIGLILGVAGCVLTTRYLAALLFGVLPVDAMTFVGVALVLLGVATTAAFIPAWRATRIDPLIALRSA